MKIIFKDSSYIEISLTDNNKIMISLGALEEENKIKTLKVQSCSLSKDQYFQLISEIPNSFLEKHVESDLNEL